MIMGFIFFFPLCILCKIVVFVIRTRKGMFYLYDVIDARVGAGVDSVNHLLSITLNHNYRTEFEVQYVFTKNEGLKISEAIRKGLHLTLLVSDSICVFLRWRGKATFFFISSQPFVFQ